MQYRYYSGAGRWRQISLISEIVTGLGLSPSFLPMGGLAGGKPSIKNYPSLMFAFRSWPKRSLGFGRQSSCACKRNNPKEGRLEILGIRPSPRRCLPLDQKCQLFK
ncbi:hypothetical protein PoB_004666300 [Plakobranchus ocellatus]|uniref:Uncharacterized protein n=1 Tax=Plakobranchus ocellatus TaxID=259542 RepID=A0AAV4BMX9_9GAST|nr:hypothetical protein PoB_004666300 [Plakobranchus ocellatus]